MSSSSHFDFFKTVKPSTIFWFDNGTVKQYYGDIPPQCKPLGMDFNGNPVYHGDWAELPLDGRNEEKLLNAVFNQLCVLQLISKEFSEQEKAPKEMLERAKKEGVIQKGSDGTWRIVSLKKGTLWSAHYKSREKALGALRAYQKNKRGG